MPANLSVNVISSKQIIFIALSFILLIFVIGLLKKLFYFLFFRRKVYLFTRITTKGISNIAMVISISISCIIILIFLTGGAFGVLFRAYPGWRTNIETMLIKTGGLLYGPLIGLFIGAMTDFLTIVITASSFHYGYFIVCILCGLISGLLHFLWNVSIKNKLFFSILSSVIYVLLLALILTYVWWLPLDSFNISLLNWDIVVTKQIIIWIFTGLFIFAILLTWIAYLVDHKKQITRSYLKWKYHKKIETTIHHHLWNSKNRQSFSDWQLNFYSHNASWINTCKSKLNLLEDAIKTQKQKASWYSCFSSVLLMVVVVETIINIIIVPCFDVEFSVYPFQYWFVLRTVMLFILIPLNIFVIYSIFKIIISMSHYDLHNKSVIFNNSYGTYKVNRLWKKKH